LSIHRPATDPHLARTLERIYRALLGRFGCQHWWPGTAEEMVIGSVLTQYTRWENAELALHRLRARRLGNLAGVAGLTNAALGRLVRPAGCASVKAERLRAVAGWIEARGGLTGLRRLPTARLRTGLCGVRGIGPETADAILLYALGRPVFVVDDYTRRVLHRYGILTGHERYGAVQQLLHSSLPPEPALYGEYHALIVRLAKTHCRVKPSCAGCPLARLT